MKPGDLVTPAPFYESYGLDPVRPKNDGDLPHFDPENFVPWEMGEVGLVIETFRLGNTRWVKLLVDKGTGFCHADELRLCNEKR